MRTDRRQRHIGPDEQVSGRAGGRAGMKLVVGFRNFANAPKTALHKHTTGLFVTSETSLAVLYVAGPAKYLASFAGLRLRN